ncbi:MAG: squalene synthase HpnC [Bacteroidetes bacterium]|nr:squalene synthase HpnC [Bacteroidota bacterium]
MGHPFEKLAQQHYENFPVGSFFIPKRYRRPIHLIYAFSRVADDIADEGNMLPETRIASLDAWERTLEKALGGEKEDDFFTELAAVIREFDLSPQLLKDLLIAFRKDASNPRYDSFDEVLEYCRYSANPIGRLLLQIFKCSNETTEKYSDHICTALQLANFWQDISVDTGRNRFYIPRLELSKFELSESDITASSNQEAFTSLMKHLVERTEAILIEGKTLLDIAPKVLRFEMRLIWHGGMTILQKIRSAEYDTRHFRPALTKIDKAAIFFKALYH